MTAPRRHAYLHPPIISHLPFYTSAEPRRDDPQPAATSPPCVPRLPCLAKEQDHAIWYAALIGATLVVTLCSLSQPSWGQECPDCYSDTYSQAVCPNCASGNRDASPCFDPSAQACRGKACYGYRPFTESSQPDLFYNYYVPNNQGAAAAAYPAPYPTPSLIGHTYYTYQPFLPHEFMYTHRRTYHQYYDGGMGLNRTSVRWGRTPVRTALKDFGGSVGWYLGNLHR